MEPSIGLVERIMYPIAAFASGERASDMETIEDDTESWQSSMLNPRNRPNSLIPIKEALWRMDGCQTDGAALWVR